MDYAKNNMDCTTDTFYGDPSTTVPVEVSRLRPKRWTFGEEEIRPIALAAAGIAWQRVPSGLRSDPHWIEVAPEQGPRATAIIRALTEQNIAGHPYDIEAALAAG